MISGALTGMARLLVAQSPNRQARHRMRTLFERYEIVVGSIIGGPCVNVTSQC